MTRTTLRIDQITIHSRGMSPEMVQAAVKGLGQELLQRLAQQRKLPMAGMSHLDHLDLGTVTIPQGETSHRLRQTLGQALAQTISHSATGTGR